MKLTAGLTQEHRALNINLFRDAAKKYLPANVVDEVCDAALRGLQDAQSAIGRQDQAIEAAWAITFDREAIAWALGKLKSFGVVNSTMDGALMADRLEAMLAAPATARAEEAPSPIAEIAAERKRQIGKEGWDREHDDEHIDGALARAGACYAANASASLRGDCKGIPPHQSIGCPWSIEWWKPKGPRRDLIRAAALIVAEIERLDRSRDMNSPRQEE